VPEWFAIEVFDGDSSARLWQDSYGDAIVAAAQGKGATEWIWQRFRWGVVLELELPDEFAWDRLREHPAVTAALDAVPDPVRGLSMHRGRGGSAGSRRGRRPKPFAGAGAVALPLPVDAQGFSTSASPDVDREPALSRAR
jgi:hypothetical protein